MVLDISLTQLPILPDADGCGSHCSLHLDPYRSASYDAPSVWWHRDQLPCTFFFLCLTISTFFRSWGCSIIRPCSFFLQFPLLDPINPATPQVLMKTYEKAQYRHDRCSQKTTNREQPILGKKLTSSNIPITKKDPCPSRRKRNCHLSLTFLGKWKH